MDYNLTEIACLIVNTDFGYEYIIISSFIIGILFYPYSMHPIPIIATFVKNQDLFFFIYEKQIKNSCKQNFEVKCNIVTNFCNAI